ncbi:MAG: hypothetical protein ACRDTD_32755 [Pseudonocardiaceae bacterium]
MTDEAFAADANGNPDNDGYPGCGATHGVQWVAGTSPEVQARMCAACGLCWATTVINPVLSLVGLLPHRRCAQPPSWPSSAARSRSRKRSTP